MDDGDLLRDIRQVQRFFDCGVAAADHRDILLLVEKAVAGRAGRHALAHEQFFRGQAQVLRRCAGRDDQRVACVFARVADQPDRAFFELGGVDVVEQNFSVEPFRVFLGSPARNGARRVAGAAHHSGEPAAR